MEAHGPANKDGENLEKSGILRRRRFSRGDGTTNSSQRGAIIEADAGSIRLNTKLHPQATQVYAHRVVFHFCIERFENIRSDRAVSDS